LLNREEAPRKEGTGADKIAKEFGKYGL